MTPAENTVPHPPQQADGSFPIPKLFWAAVAMFALDLIVFMWVALSPALDLKNNESAVPAYHAEVADKPSPAIYSIAKHRTLITRAPKLRPVLYRQPEEDFSIPRYTAASQTTLPVEPRRVEKYVSGDKMYRAIDRTYDFPRMTASTYRRTTEAPQPN